MKVKFKKINPQAVIPQYAHNTDAGLDLTAIEIVKQNRNQLWFDTGLAVEIPEGYVGLIFPRSSITKMDLSLGNSVGVIDSGYRGSISFRFNIINNGENLYKVGDRIGQLIIVQYPKIEIELSDNLSETDRNIGGFGSTNEQNSNQNIQQSPIIEQNSNQNDSKIVEFSKKENNKIETKQEVKFDAPKDLNNLREVESAYKQLGKSQLPQGSICPVCDGSGRSGYCELFQGDSAPEPGSIEKCPTCKGTGRI